MKKIFLTLSMFLVMNTSCSNAGDETSKSLKGYRSFDIRINIEWGVNKDKIPSGGVQVYETIGSGVINVGLYFPANGGEALENYGLAKITDYDFYNAPALVTISGDGLKNETISFYKPVWDGKNTITISGVEYTSIPIDVTIHHPPPVPPATVTDRNVYDRLLGAFTEARGVGVLNEFKLNTESGASNYFPSVYYNKDWHYANITFVVVDKGIVEK